MDLYSEMYADIIIKFPKLETLEIRDTCLTNVFPLSYIFEFETENGRKSLCLNRRGKTHDWITNECDDICKEYEIYES